MIGPRRAHIRMSLGVLALATSSPALAATGAWSDFGPTLASVPANGHCKLPYANGYMFVPSSTTPYRTPLVDPAWTPLANYWSGVTPYRMGINKLGNPVANGTNTVSYWDGSRWNASTMNPAPSGQQWWYGSVGNIVLEPVSGDLFTAGNFSIQKSTDNGATFNQIFNLGTVCPSGGGYGYIYTLERMPWGELIIGGESDTFYHSLDNGVSWSALPAFSKGGNRYGSGVTKDGEILLSTAPDASGNLIFRYTRDGKLVPAMNGLAVYQFNYQTTYAFTIAYSSSGENFMVPLNNTYNDGLVHVLKWDGTIWTKIESLPNGPGNSLVVDEIASDGTNIYVETTGKQLKKWTPSAVLPFTVNAGSNLNVAAGGSATLNGQVSPAGSYTHSWAARGPGTVTFSAPASLSTTATFSTAGDYVLNLQSTSGGVTAGSSLIVHYGKGGCVAILEIPYDGIDQDCDGEDLIDVDDDGYNATVAGGDDCNDKSSSIHPGAAESCNSIDDNCNGQVDEGSIGSTWYQDADGDGYGNAAVSKSACAQPAGYVSTATDCDDTKASVHPGATETCNGMDDNCSGGIDEGVKSSYYIDGDGDTYGKVGSTATQACTRPTGYSINSTDCNDASAAINPGATEVCNGIDDNCSGAIDEGLSSTWYKDADGDGYGTASVTTTACAQPAGYVSKAGDCNDANASINPGATEVCNADGSAPVDDNCNGEIDEGLATTWYKDADGDGYGTASVTSLACAQPAGYVAKSGDCNDANTAINPGATEVCNADGSGPVDDNCNGSIDEGLSTTWYKDADGDGYGTPTVTSLACSQPTGYVAKSGDCNDASASINPGATEVCNADGSGPIDDNCNGAIDEGLSTSSWYKDVDGDGYGTTSTTVACSQPTGYVAKGGDCNDENPGVNPGQLEVPGNGIDDNCDGTVDEGGGGDDDTTGGDDDATAGDDDATSGDDDATAGDDDATAGDDDATAGDDDATAGDDDATAGDDDTTGGDDDATAGDDDATSGDDDATSGDDDATAGDDDATAGDDDATGSDGSSSTGCSCTTGTSSPPPAGALLWACLAPLLIRAHGRRRKPGPA